MKLVLHTQQPFNTSVPCALAILFDASKCNELLFFVTEKHVNVLN